MSSTVNIKRTVHYRFQVGDSICGWVADEQSLHSAVDEARSHMKRHACCAAVGMTIFDRMARQTATNEWFLDTQGVLHCKARKEGASSHA